jgi:hypothetical protein
VFSNNEMAMDFDLFIEVLAFAWIGVTNCRYENSVHLLKMSAVIGLMCDSKNMS